MKEYEGYGEQKNIKLTCSEFKCYFLKWIIESYHRLPAGGNDKTPYELWVSSEDRFPIVEENEQSLSHVLLRSDVRRLSASGIRVNALQYGSPLLKEMYERDGPVKVAIKTNPFDLGHVLVFDSVKKTYVRVDCLNYSYANGLHLHTHKLLSRESVLEK